MKRFFFAWDVVVRDVVFESDSKIIVDALSGVCEVPIAIDSIIGGIRIKMQDFRRVSISHVKCHDNRLVHLLV